MFYLNGRKIRLRGANTMGFEQQDVLRRDFDRLIDDILLAKICNMNYWRLTQRPVQEEIYEYCDKLGLMTQTDLPVFGCMRRPMVCEALRQTATMIRRRRECRITIVTLCGTTVMVSTSASCIRAIGCRLSRTGTMAAANTAPRAWNVQRL